MDDIDHKNIYNSFLQLNFTVKTTNKLEAITYVTQFYKINYFVTCEINRTKHSTLLS